jgi:hypothetical protein
MIGAAMGLAAGALFLWMRNRPAHARGPAYLEKTRNKLRAKVRRDLRSHRGKAHRGYRRGMRKLQREMRTWKK